MAIATMTAAAAALYGSAIGAGTNILGGVIQSRSNNRQMSMQERARQEALAYEREREAQQQMRADAAYRDYRERHAAWLERNFGVPRAPAGRGWNVPGNERNPYTGLPAAVPGAPGASPGAAPVPTPGAPVVTPQVPPVVPPVDPGVPPPDQPGIPTPTGPVPITTSAMPPLIGQQPRSLADLGGWSARNFERYLGRA